MTFCCDICGKELKPASDSYYLVLGSHHFKKDGVKYYWGEPTANYYNEIELCDDCAEYVENLVQQKRHEERQKNA